VLVQTTRKRKENQMKLFNSVATFAIIAALFLFAGVASATSTYLVGFQFVSSKAYTTDKGETGHVIPVSILFNTPA